MATTMLLVTHAQCAARGVVRQPHESFASRGGAVRRLQTARAPYLHHRTTLATASASPPLQRGAADHRRTSVVARAGAPAQGSFKVSFPSSEEELMSQIQTSVQAALADGASLIEVEIPPFSNAGPGVNNGDCIAISEMNAQQKMLRSFCELFEWLGQAERVRVFFPDSGEASIALNGIGMNPVSGQWNQEPTFHNWPGPVDYLLRDDLLTQTVNKSYGYADLPKDMQGKKKVEEKTEVEDMLYVIGYPYDSDDELYAVNRLWDAHARRTIVFNGNIDGVRSGFYPFGGKKKMKQEFVPKFTTAYYVHQFRSTIRPGMLFRAYPGPWRVLRTMEGGGFECVEEFDDMPKMQDVAKKWFSGALTTSKMAVAETVVELSDNNTLYYERLGLATTASQEEVVAAYRERVKVTHPDVGGDPMEFYEVNKAYAVLKDPRKRELYNQFGEKWVDER